MDLTPPPVTETYTSLEALITALNTHAAAQGYAVVKQRTKKNPKSASIFKAYFRCDRGGKPENKAHAQKRKHSGTRLIDCPFTCFALDKMNVGWVIVIRNPSHNHTPTIEGAHPAICKMALTADVIANIDNQSKAHATPSQILTSMRLQEDNCALKTKDIYNVKQAIRRKALGYLSPIQSLLNALEKENWFYKYETTPISKEITHLFFVEKNTVDILKENSEVLLMDCTYKTNKYKLPLLVIVGHTSLGTSFYVGFAFMTKEKEADYLWVLSALHTYFIEKNILLPTVIVTDRDLGLMAAVRVIFPTASHLLCI